MYDSLKVSNYKSLSMKYNFSLFLYFIIFFCKRLKLYIEYSTVFLFIDNILYSTMMNFAYCQIN